MQTGDATASLRLIRNNLLILQMYLYNTERRVEPEVRTTACWSPETFIGCYRRLIKEILLHLSFRAECNEDPDPRFHVSATYLRLPGTGSGSPG